MRHILFALVLAISSAALAQGDVSDGDSAAIKAVILDQLDAFNRDDGNRAFSHASPSIQDKFRSVDVFMTMVRQAYLPVYRSAAAKFGQVHLVDGIPYQQVYVTGQNGEAVLAVYTMEQQDDGSWRINGCTLYPTPDLSA
ncbi:MAG: DUF4864 domain-containing protein [Rhodospirillales bacterium]|nr:DUF4864 domain-containing protein [Rhodospirillales bacterium]